MTPTPQVGPYQFIRPLGTGGLFEVHLARLVGSQNPQDLCTLKILHEHHPHPNFIAAMVQAAHRARECQHPNVGQIFNFGVWQNRHFLELEAADGQSFQVFLQHSIQRLSQVPLDVVVAVGIELCAGLNHIHTRRDPYGSGQPLVHGALSPDNIFVTYGGQIKILDLGMAQSRLQPGQEPPSKWAYVSPEQANGELLDPRTDIYGVGLILFEMATGRPAHHTPDSQQVLNSVRSGAIAPPRQFRGDIPFELDNLIMRALSLNPAARFNSAQEMLEALAFFQRQGHGPSHQPLPAFAHHIYQQPAPPPGSPEERRAAASRRQNYYTQSGATSLLQPAQPASMSQSHPSMAAFNPPSNPSMAAFNPPSNPSMAAFNPPSNPSMAAFNPPSNPSMVAFNPSNSGGFPRTSGAFTPSASGAFSQPASGVFAQPSSGTFSQPASGTFTPSASGTFTPSASGAFSQPASGVFSQPSSGAFKPAASGAFATPQPTQESSTRAVDIAQMGILEGELTTNDSPSTRAVDIAQMGLLEEEFASGDGNFPSTRAIDVASMGLLEKEFASDDGDIPSTRAIDVASMGLLEKEFASGDGAFPSTRAIDIASMGLLEEDLASGDGAYPSTRAIDVASMGLLEEDLALNTDPSTRAIDVASMGLLEEDEEEEEDNAATEAYDPEAMGLYDGLDDDSDDNPIPASSPPPVEPKLSAVPPSRPKLPPKPPARSKTPSLEKQASASQIIPQHQQPTPKPELQLDEDNALAARRNLNAGTTPPSGSPVVQGESNGNLKMIIIGGGVVVVVLLGIVLAILL